MVKKTTKPTDASITRNFIEQVLLKGTTGKVFLGTIPHDKDMRRAEATSIVTRDLDTMVQFAAKYDTPEMKVSVYYATCELKGRKRVKDNWGGSPFVFTDIDFKDVDLPQADILDRLSKLKHPPTRVINSGNGLHVHWDLEQSFTGDVDRYEGVLKAIARTLAGDVAVTQCVALLRLPGTHNSKRGEWKPVEVIFDHGTRYSFDTLEGFFDRHIPVILRSAEAKLNPFERQAQAQEFKAPLSIEDSLEELKEMKEGDGIHSLRIRMMMAMANQGWEIDDAITAYMEAISHHSGWNMAKEERDARADFRSGMRKVEATKDKKFQVVKPPAKAVGSASAAAKDDSDDKVVSLDQRRTSKRQAEEPEDEEEDEKPRGGGKGGKGKGDKTHIVLAEGVLESIEGSGELIRFIEGQLWHYREGLWSAYPTDKDYASFLNQEIEKGFRPLKVVSTTKLVNEAREYIKRQSHLHATGVKWDDKPGIHTLSGVIDPYTMAVRAAVPEDYWASRIDVHYDPEATCPHWLQLLEDTFGDGELVDMLQEVLGAALLKNKPKEITKALVLIGGSNSGKSTILNVMAGLFGERTNATTFKMIETNAHGTVDFLRPIPWVLHEAFEQGVWQESSAVKALLSGDPIQVNIKGGAVLEHRFKAPVFWGSNAPPQFKESSRAMENRLLPIRCARIFTDDNPVGVAIESRERGYPSPAAMVLAEEREGLLMWAIKGVKRLKARNWKFLPHSNTSGALSEMRRDSNMVSGFLEDCCDFDPTTTITTANFAYAFNAWWEETHGSNRSGKGGTERLGRQLKALADARIGMGPEFRLKKGRCITGLRLNEMGLRYYSQGVPNTSANQLADYDDAEDVNMDTPEAFVAKPEYALILAAYPDGPPARPGAPVAEGDVDPPEAVQRTPEPPTAQPAKARSKGTAKASGPGGTALRPLTKKRPK